MCEDPKVLIRGRIGIFVDHTQETIDFKMTEPMENFYVDIPSLLEKNSR